MRETQHPVHVCDRDNIDRKYRLCAKEMRKTKNAVECDRVGVEEKEDRKTERKGSREDRRNLLAESAD